MWPLNHYQCNFYTRYQPVHLWSVEEDGGASIAGTYKCINALDELSHAFSVAVAQDGESIFCGLKGEVCAALLFGGCNIIDQVLGC